MSLTRRFLGIVSVCVVSLLLAGVTSTLAFGDFVPVTTAKVLGVGRIQSAPSATPVASEEKFALATRAADSAPVEPVAELVEPIARAVAAVEQEPEPEPIVEPTPEPVVAEPAPAASEPVANAGAWINTLATNYATPGDGFLGKKTASGAVTTTTGMGVAHKTLPLGTVVEFYCPKTGLSCTATVNDRGPYDGRPDSFDFQMGVTSALGNNTGWYAVQYRITS
ncbi:MAG: septal ring lytic transglycosylase RlpA family protein [Coriobacteriales bacterium]|nr:septal ring lytic transglycosylase RlpA family protein [Coriobacteriales bacterium]